MPLTYSHEKSSELAMNTPFDSLEQLPPDPIFGLDHAFKMDPRENKINLGIGAYKDHLGHSVLLNSVQKAEGILFNKNIAKDYLPIAGSQEYISLMVPMIYGIEHPAYHEKRIAACQAVGGTGALRLGGDILKRAGAETIYIPDPTWLNHALIYQSAGIKVATYPYYNSITRSFDFDALLQSMLKMPKGSVILLQVCCHNPTGIDPTQEQWMQLSGVIKKLELIPFFDFAYQGFGEGWVEDAFPVRYFAEQGHEMLVATTNSKNFGLYSERIGLLSIVSKDPDNKEILESHMKNLIRGNYSNPATHGAQIVTTILKDSALYEEWQKELMAIRKRIHAIRGMFVDKLGPRFEFMRKQEGMFSYSGLTSSQVLRLREDDAIYMPNNGRINVAGLNELNIDRVVEAIHTVATS